MAGQLQHFEQPSFTETENVFLRCYAESLDRVGAMILSGMAGDLGIDLNDHTRLQLAAASIIAKAESMPITAIASALGADRIALLRQIWHVCLNGEPREQSKALLLMAKIHGLLGTGQKAPRAVQLILHEPEQVQPTVTGLPFSLELPPESGKTST